MKKIHLILLLLSSCNLGPVYEFPVVDLPDNWKHQTAEDIQTEEEVCEQVPKISPLDWWIIFNEPLLNALEDSALENNPSLEESLWRVEEAWALAGLSRSQLFPQITLNPSYTSTGALIKLYQPPDLVGFPLPFEPYRVHQLLYTLPVNLNYELDLWGRLRKAYEADRLNAESKEEAYRSSLLTLTAQVASSYFNVKILTTQIKIYELTLENRIETVKISEARVNKGLSNELEVTQALIEKATTEAGLLEAVRQKELEINRLATLVGKNPSDFDVILEEIQNDPPKIPAGVPATLLLSRPDLAEAERMIASQNARVGAAWASYFPDFSLTGAIGFLSPTTKDFIKWFSRYWSLGASANQNLFDGGQRDSNYEVAFDRFKQADSSYKNLVLTAFREVEDALNNIHFQERKKLAYLNAQNSAQKSLNIGSDRFKRGLSNRLEVIDFQRSLLNAQLNTVGSLGEEYQATIQLIKALGGRWNTSDDCCQ